MKKIKAVILDVDGVIVGDKVGINSPDPHPLVLQKLKNIRAGGIPIILCTAKPHYTIGTVIRDAVLNNYHVTDGGALIIDPISNAIVEEHLVPSGMAEEVIKLYEGSDAYMEFYTPDAYFAQKNRVSDITHIHEKILQHPPELVDSLIAAAKNKKITKIMPIAHNAEEMKPLEDKFEHFKNKLSMVWAIHPIALPLQFGIITAKGVTKKGGAQAALTGSNISYQEALGVGDSTSDWSFMEECGYVAAMGNATEELKTLVKNKRDAGFVGPSVNENGIINILDYFLK